MNWKPPKIKITDEMLMSMFEDDYTHKEILKFEKQFLGYYISSPLFEYDTIGSSIGSAKIDGMLECIVEDVKKKKTANGDTYLRLDVSDGIETAILAVWSSDVNKYGDIFDVDAAIRAGVKWNSTFRSFTIDKSIGAVPLRKRDVTKL